MPFHGFQTTEDIASYYRNNIDLYGFDNPRTMGYHTGPIDARLISNLLPDSVPTNYSVLDVGCGLGQAIPILNETYKHSNLTRFVGLDIVEEFVRICAGQYLRYEFRTKDFLAWNSQERFDIVLAAGVLVTRIADYHSYLEKFVAKMVSSSAGWIGFNLIAGRSEQYTAKHLITITDESLAELLSKFPGVDWRVTRKEVFPGSEDTFICGSLTGGESPR